MVDETHNPFVGDEAKFEQREKELQKKLVGLKKHIHLLFPRFRDW